MSNHKFNDYWAVTMFSFTNELLAAEKTPLELIEQALQLTKNIEVDGPQHFRNFPNPPAAEIAALKALLAKHDAKISLIGGAIDRAKSATRMVSSAEVIESVKAQLALAAEFGAFGLRLMVGGLSLEELKAVAPTAERLNVKMLYELHGVMAADSQTARNCLKLIKEVNSSHVRLMFDTSLFMTELPNVLHTALRNSGINNFEEINQHWQSLELEEFKAWLFAQDMPPQFRAFIPTLTSRMGHSKPSDYDDYLDYIEAVHIKFWDLDGKDDDQELFAYLNKDLYLTSEWGGHEWETKATSAYEMTKAHKQLVERSFDLAH